MVNLELRKCTVTVYVQIELGDERYERCKDAVRKQLFLFNDNVNVSILLSSAAKGCKDINSVWSKEHSGALYTLRYIADMGKIFVI